MLFQEHFVVSNNPPETRKLHRIYHADETRDFTLKSSALNFSFDSEVHHFDNLLRFTYFPIIFLHKIIPSAARDELWGRKFTVLS